MRLLFENWRKYLAEEQEAYIYFENPIQLDEKKGAKQKFIKSLKDALPKEDINKIKGLLDRLEVMGKGKRKHSMRVSSNVASVSSDKDVVLGALFHDYVERHPNCKEFECLDELPVSKKSVALIRALSSVNKNINPNAANEPLEHMKAVFNPEDPKKLLPQGVLNNLVMIKVGDRVDNLNRRIHDEGKVGKGYLKKSIDLISWLQAQYKGDSPEKIDNLLDALEKKLSKKVGKKLSKRKEEEPGISTGGGANETVI